MSKLPGIMLIDSESNDSHDYNKKAMNFFNFNVPVTFNQSAEFIGYNNCGLVESMELYNNDATDSDKDELNDVMESLIDIMISSVMKHAGNIPENLVDHKYWREGYNAIVSLFCHNLSENSKRYTDKYRSQEAIEKIVNICYDVNGLPEGDLKNEILKYMEEKKAFFENMKLGGTKLENPCTLIGFDNFVKNGVRICRIKAYFSNINTELIKIYKAFKIVVVGKEYFNFDFHIVKCQADFMLSNWNTNPDFRENTREFIKKYKPEKPYSEIWKTARKFIVT